VGGGVCVWVGVCVWCVCVCVCVCGVEVGGNTLPEILCDGKSRRLVFTTRENHAKLLSLQ